MCQTDTGGNVKYTYGDTVKMKHVKRLRKKLYALKQEEKVEFVHGIGKRKSPLQKSIDTLEEYLGRLKGYTQKLHICGTGNSFSKTDPIFEGCRGIFKI